jgi:hypothetical protein
VFHGAPSLTRPFCSLRRNDRHRDDRTGGADARMSAMINDLITTLTDWIPWTWLEHTVEILLYMGLMMALALAPLVAWLVWVMAFPGRRRAERS